MDTALLVRAKLDGVCTAMTPLQRAGYIAHAQTVSYRRKVAEASALIARHPDYGVSVSWGKDSVVVLHLASQVLPECKAVNVRYPHWAERLADHDRVRDETLAMLPSVQYRETLCPGMWQMYEKHGLGGEGQADSNQAVAEFGREFQSAIDRLTRESAIDGHFVGMRADESYNRTRLVRMRGKEYAKANGENICLPLAGWSGTDIWAYHILHDLPHLRIYDMPADTRERQRSEMAMGSTKNRILAAHGEYAAWRKCYPREYQAWIERWPELAAGF